MGQTATQVFTSNGTFTAPNGTTRVKIVTQKAIYPLNSGPWANGAMPSLIDAYGKLYMWGENPNGELGTGDQTAKSSPVAVVGGLNFRRVSSCAGANNNQNTSVSMGMDTIGRLLMWGSNFNGQLGDGTVAAKSSPVAVLGAMSFQDFGMNFGYPNSGASCFGLNESGAIFAWGDNTSGQLGTGDVTPRSSPVAVLGGLTFQKMIVAKSRGCFGLTSAGVLYAWGFNDQGQLGVGDVVPRSSPVAVLGGLTFQKVISLQSANFSQCTLGLTSAGALYGWGNNGRGTLGVGDVTSRSSPVAVVGGLTFVDVFSDDSESAFGLTAAGALYAWGANFNGNLGDGTVTHRSSPVAVLGGLSFAKVRGVNGTMYALTSDGTAYAWGNGAGGALGDNTAVTKSSPVAVVGGLKFYDLIPVDYNGQATVMAVTFDGKLYAWGGNVNGQVGDGTTTNRSSPVQVLGGYILGLTPSAKILDLSVVPGTAYTITIQQFQAMFGTTLVDSGPVTSLTVVYEQ